MRRVNYTSFMCALLAAMIIASQGGAAEAEPPLRLLVIASGPTASRPYPDFEYFARSVGAQMTFWHTYPREWDVYHHMDSIRPAGWQKARTPLSQRADARLRELLAEQWDLVCWTGGDIAWWARTNLLTRVHADKPLIRFGYPERDRTKDELAELFKICEVIDPTILGATTSGPEKFLPEIRSDAIYSELLITPRSPCGGTSTLPYDIVELRATFWNEVVARLCKRPLPPSLAAQIPTTIQWGETISIKVDGIDKKLARKTTVTATVGRAGAATSWRGRLGKDGTVNIPTTGLPVGEWARVELSAQGHRPTVRWVELTPPVELTIKSDRFGADYGEPIALVVKSDTIPDRIEAPLTVRIVIADRQGRLLWQQNKAIRGREIEELFEYLIPDLGVETYAYYVTAWLISGKDTIGRATTTIYHYRPWDMRRQWQWSVWDSIYRYSPQRAAAGMNLIADAGFNSIGFGYATSRSVWWSERYGWRQYAEMQGGYKLWNAPVVKWSDDELLRQAVRGQINHMFKYFGGGWRSAAVNLGSLGEEPGFEKGWGRTYYWKTDTAPPVAQKAFQQFLREQYKTVAALAESWQLPLTKWEEATLDKKYSLHGQKFDPLVAPDDAPEDAKDFARYHDSVAFFTWYFEKVATIATEEIHRINPGISTFYSLHGPDIVSEIGEAASHHVYYPKEYQAAAAARERSRRDGMPVFSLIWNHFDKEPVQIAGHWSQVANQVTHVNFWLGVPLVFNDDMTHTRASIVSKRFLTKFQPISPLLAYATVVPSGAAILDGPFLNRRTRLMQTAYSSLAEAGFPPSFVTEHNLSSVKMVFASRATQITPAMAAALRRFVENGGTLVTTSGFATRTENGRPVRVAPAEGLDKWMGFRFGKWLRSDHLGAGMVQNGGPFRTSDNAGALSNIDIPSAPSAVVLSEIAADVKILGKFPDDTPSLLYRRIGKGSVYHMNFLFGEWGWPVLYTPARKGLRQIISGIAQREGLSPRFFVECSSHGFPEGTSMPFWGTQLFVGRDGTTHYLVVHNDHRNKLMTGRVNWYEKGWQISDLIANTDMMWTGSSDKGSYLDLPLLPGHGKILRLVPHGKIAESMPEQPVHNAIKAARTKVRQPMIPVVPRGWPSEKLPTASISSKELLDNLATLSNIYKTGESRHALSYYQFDGSANNRHSITRLLSEQNWQAHLSPITEALEKGARILLTGEDVGLDPATGLHVTTHRPHVLETIAEIAARRNTKVYSPTDDGQVLLIAVGKGRLVLDRTSIDSIGFHDRDIKAWHHKWWQGIAASVTNESIVESLGSIKAPDVGVLRSWFTGQRHLTDRLVVDSFAGLRKEASFVRPLLAGNQHAVTYLHLPQMSKVKSATLSVKVESYPGFWNGDFEEAKAGTLAPAGMRGIYEGFGELDSNTKHGGKYSLRLQPRKVGSRSVILIAPLYLGRRDVNLKGKKYRLRFWAQCERIQRMDVKIRAMKWGESITWKNDLWIPVGTVPGGTHDWQQFEFTCVLPDTRANYMNLHFVAHGNEHAVIWLDDIEAMEMPTDVRIGVGGEPGKELSLPEFDTPGSTTISDGLAELINAYLPRAPINDNGMRVVPIHVSMEGHGKVRLSNPNIVMQASGK